MKPANFLTRSLTALVFAGILITSIFLGAVYFASLMFIVSFISIREFYKLTIPSVSIKNQMAGIATGSITFVLIFLFNYGLVAGKYLWSIPLVLFIPFLIPMTDKTTPSLTAAGNALSVTAFIALPLSIFSSIIPSGDLHANNSGRELLLGFLAILWVTDSAAYLLGSTFGKHKLCQRLSPGKTWEGSLGGLFFGLLVAWVIAEFFSEIPLIHWIIIAGIIAVFGTLGDLCESMIKRIAGVKDSGNVLPGHGGVLDRFDAVLMSAPAVYFYIIIIL